MGHFSSPPSHLDVLTERFRPPLIVEQGTLVRLRLNAAHGISRQAAVTLITAPAGYGKTTALAHLAAASGRTVVWYSAEPRDNHPLRFLYCVLAALATHIDGKKITSLDDPHSYDQEMIARRILDLILELPGPSLLVIDDLQYLDDQTIQEAIRLVVEYAPAQLQFTFASRTTTSLPISRWRARGFVAEIRAEDLRFTTDEIHELCTLWLDYDLPENSIDQLSRSTEGWVAALRLMVARLLNEPVHNLSAALDRLSSGQPHLVEYLDDEVMSNIPVEQLQVIERTSILSRLRDDLCTAVLGGDYKPGTLETLLRSGALITAPRDDGGWYQYHPLFRDNLQRRLAASTSTEEVSTLHSRASVWWESHGDVESAADHAILAQDWKRASTLVMEVVLQFQFRHQLSNIEQWFNTLPSEFLDESPEFAHWYAWMLLRSGHFRSYENHLRIAEQHWQEAGNKTMIGALASTRAFAAFYRGDGEECLRLAGNAVASLDVSRPIELQRARLAQALGETHLGRADVACRLLEEFIHTEPSDSPLMPDAIVHHCWALWLRGNLREARERLITFIRTFREGFSDAVRRAYVILADISLERGDSDEAARFLTAADDHAVRFGSVPLLADARSRWATLYFRAGDYNTALSLLDSLDADSALVQNRRVSAKAMALRARIWMLEGRVDLVERWVRQQNLSKSTPITFSSEIELSTLAYWRLQQGHVHEGLELATALCEEVASTGRVIHLVRFLTLKAVAESACGNRDDARRTVIHVLELAETTGALMALVPGGDALSHLMGDIDDAKRFTIVIERINAAVQASSNWCYVFPLESSRPKRHGSLSLRELEVLQLIAIGLSNRDISSQLSISLPTVKRHLSNVFTKLDASSRTDAVHKARTQKILS